MQGADAMANVLWVCHSSKVHKLAKIQISKDQHSWVVWEVKET